MTVDQPIAVLDSGVGGLTVVQALRQRMPAEQIIYFADTARLPYGSRSPESIVAFLRQIVAYLLRFRPKHVVIACNTATAAALPAIRAAYPELSISGVIEPTARAAVEAAGARAQPTIGVLATETTVRTRAYEQAIARHRNKASVVLRSSSLLVPIIEEGRQSFDPLVRLALRQYLHPLLQRRIDVLVLGCTHYPILRQAFDAIVGSDIAVVDCADKTAEDVARRLGSRNLLATGSEAGTLRCIVSDDPSRMQQLARRMLNIEINLPHVVNVQELLESVLPMELRQAG